MYILFAFIPSINASTIRFPNEFAVVYKDKPLKRYNLMSQPQVIMAKKLWIWSNLSMQGVGTEYSLNSRMR